MERGGVSGAGIGSFRDYRGLFYGFPDFGGSDLKFTISAKGRLPVDYSEIMVSAGYAERRESPDGLTSRYEPVAPDSIGDYEVVPSFWIVTPGRDRIVPLRHAGRISKKSPSLFGDFSPEQSGGIELVYLDPFSSRKTSNLGSLWDRVALTNAQDEVVNALKLVSPDITAVSMIGGEESAWSRRTAIVRSDLFKEPVNLRTFGDGVNRLFGIILSLCNAKGGLLLVDEIDNGLHYSIQLGVWKTVFRLAKQLDVQVFATSHSWDCVTAFAEAASDNKEVEGVLTRLTRVGERIVPSTFTEDDLKIVTEYGIEVR